MSEAPKSVIIDGVRYLPASEAVAGQADLREALLRLYWGAAIPERDLGDELYVFVFDDPTGLPDPPTVNGFMADLAARLAKPDGDRT